MSDMESNAVSALAYALWDAENTTRLPPELYEAYASRARDIFYVMRYRTDGDRRAIAKEVLGE